MPNKYLDYAGLTRVVDKIESEIPAPSAATPAAPGTDAVGSSTAYARADHRHASQTTVSGNAGTATKLASPRAIDGVSFDGAAAITHFGICSTEAATVEKAVAIPGFALVAGAVAYVQFTITNTAADPTLNVNGTGAKPVYLNNAVASAGLLAANRLMLFIYDGGQYEIVYSYDSNTTYGAMSVDEGKTGTATSSRVVRADYLKQIVQAYSAPTDVATTLPIWSGSPGASKTLVVALPTGWTNASACLHLAEGVTESQQTEAERARFRVISSSISGGTLTINYTIAGVGNTAAIPITVTLTRAA
jgi:hypothetical protein